METKYCIKCEKIKPISEFHQAAKAKDGLQSWCKKCTYEYNAEYKDKHTDRLTARDAKYYMEHRKEKAAYCAEHAERIAISKREVNLRHKYGITLEDYDEILESQDNRCAICGKTPEENGKRLYVDHNHETDEVRGLLCRNCNLALGYLQDSPELCRITELYLRRTEN